MILFEKIFGDLDLLYGFVCVCVVYYVVLKANAFSFLRLNCFIVTRSLRCFSQSRGSIESSLWYTLLANAMLLGNRSIAVEV